ncbi:hypothetical protein TNCT_501531 [Trichonephila clavata]|uniref:Uncharacterized protein n=1 Tax=Trichonephila clavata TaxID=2740835 RepID=A0A8X6HWB8_TRICU|nr:hypothetical protein TNCT_501531 [Trichonephila clavata]
MQESRKPRRLLIEMKVKIDWKPARYLNFHSDPNQQSEWTKRDRINLVISPDDPVPVNCESVKGPVKHLSLFNGRRTLDPKNDDLPKNLVTLKEL